VQKVKLQISSPPYSTALIIVGKRCKSKPEKSHYSKRIGPGNNSQPSIPNLPQNPNPANSAPNRPQTSVPGSPIRALAQPQLHASPIPPQSYSPAPTAPREYDSKSGAANPLGERGEPCTHLGSLVSKEQKRRQNPSFNLTQVIISLTVNRRCGRMTGSHSLDCA